MITTSLINAKHFTATLRKNLIEDMMKAAEPIIEQAIEKARVEMRKRLAEKVVGLIDQSYQIERNGVDLRILVKLAPSVGHDMGGAYER